MLLMNKKLAITKKEQEIYKSIQFYTQIKKLEKLGLISSFRKTGYQDKTYILTQKGTLFLKMIGEPHG